MTDNEGCEFPKSTNVTETFDRTKKYYRVLRKNETKYKVGMNCNDGSVSEEDVYWPLEMNEWTGGFYFTNVECVINYIYGWGDRICEVTVPENTFIYKDDESLHYGGDNIWRASCIILSEPEPLTLEVVRRLISEGGILNNYNINMNLFRLEMNAQSLENERFGNITENDRKLVIKYLYDCIDTKKSQNDRTQNNVGMKLSGKLLQVENEY